MVSSIKDPLKRGWQRGLAPAISDTKMALRSAWRPSRFEEQKKSLQLETKAFLPSAPANELDDLAFQPLLLSWSQIQNVFPRIPPARLSSRVDFCNNKQKHQKKSKDYARIYLKQKKLADSYVLGIDARWFSFIHFTFGISIYIILYPIINFICIYFSVVRNICI